tara:strand:+ start:113 stop:340 length:228 start_codon:yes stop_codon:yes gene_type:complete
MTQFEKLGFFIEYMIDTKYIGTITIEQPDREEIGYYGRIDSVANQDILLDNNKRIKKGQSYYTRMYPLCGKYINK